MAVPARGWLDRKLQFRHDVGLCLFPASRSKSCRPPAARGAAASAQPAPSLSRESARPHAPGDPRPRRTHRSGAFTGRAQQKGLGNSADAGPRAVPEGGRHGEAVAAPRSPRRWGRCAERGTWSCNPEQKEREDQRGALLARGGSTGEQAAPSGARAQRAAGAWRGQLVCGQEPGPGLPARGGDGASVSREPGVSPGGAEGAGCGRRCPSGTFPLWLHIRGECGVKRTRWF